MDAKTAALSLLLIGSSAVNVAQYKLAAGEVSTAGELETWAMPATTAADIAAAFDGSFTGLKVSSYICERERGTLDGKDALVASCHTGDRVTYLGARVADALTAGVDASAPGLRWRSMACSAADGTLDGKPATITTCKVLGARLATSMADLKPGQTIVSDFASQPVEAVAEVIP